MSKTERHSSFSSVGVALTRPNGPITRKIVRSSRFRFQEVHETNLDRLRRVCGSASNGCWLRGRGLALLRGRQQNPKNWTAARQPYIPKQHAYLGNRGDEEELCESRRGRRNAGVLTNSTLAEHGERTDRDPHGQQEGVRHYGCRHRKHCAGLRERPAVELTVGTTWTATAPEQEMPDGECRVAARVETWRDVCVRDAERRARRTHCAVPTKPVVTARPPYSGLPTMHQLFTATLDGLTRQSSKLQSEAAQSRQQAANELATLTQEVRPPLGCSRCVVRLDCSVQEERWRSSATTAEADDGSCADRQRHDLGGRRSGCVGTALLYDSHDLQGSVFLAGDSEGLEAWRQQRESSRPEVRNCFAGQTDVHPVILTSRRHDRTHHSLETRDSHLRTSQWQGLGRKNQDFLFR